MCSPCGAITPFPVMLTVPGYEDVILEDVYNYDGKGYDH
jgi:hypothetical protein